MGATPDGTTLTFFDALGAYRRAIAKCARREGDLSAHVTALDEANRARAVLLAAHAAAVTEAAARGRAAALAEVDAALETIATDGLHSDPPAAYSSSIVNVERQAWRDGTTMWGLEDETAWHSRPTAALLAAAATLRADEADDAR